MHTLFLQVAANHSTNKWLNIQLLGFSATIRCATAAAIWPPTVALCSRSCVIVLRLVNEWMSEWVSANKESNLILRKCPRWIRAWRPTYPRWESSRSRSRTTRLALPVTVIIFILSSARNSNFLCSVNFQNGIFYASILKRFSECQIKFLSMLLLQEIITPYHLMIVEFNFAPPTTSEMSIIQDFIIYHHSLKFNA